MKGLFIMRDDAVVAGRVRIEIPRRYFRNDDHARDFMDVLSRMRTFKLAMLNYDHPEHYDFIGTLPEIGPKTFHRLMLRVDKAYKEFTVDQRERWDMNFCRPYTSREESAALLKAGVPAVTADFYYDEGSELDCAWEVGRLRGQEFWNEVFPFCKKKKHFPSWSVVRLMQIHARCWKKEGKFDPITRQKLLAPDFTHNYIGDFLNNVKGMDFKLLKVQRVSKMSDLPF